MVAAVISGDIISSTSLHYEDRARLEEGIIDLFEALHTRFDVYGRMIKGDYLECVVREYQDSLRVALIVKSFIKSFPLSNSSNIKSSKVKLFKTHGARLAIGYGDLVRFDRDKGIIDGEAIYLSGRTISETAVHYKKRVVLKNTLYFLSKDVILNNQLAPIISLLDVLISKATSRQSEVLYFKLLSKSEDEISELLNIKQSVVNKHSTSLGWNSIEKAIMYYSQALTRK